MRALYAVGVKYGETNRLTVSAIQVLTRVLQSILPYKQMSGDRYI